MSLGPVLSRERDVDPRLDELSSEISPEPARWRRGECHPKRARVGEGEPGGAAEGLRLMPSAVLAVVKAAAEESGCQTWEVLAGPQRRAVVCARRLAVQRLWAMTMPDGRRKFSLPEIGSYLRMHHTTVHYHLGGRERRAEKRKPAQKPAATSPYNPDEPDYSGEWAI